MKRCSWCKSELLTTYHDNEWGILKTDDYYLFEMLVLEGMQAGLSWEIVLKRRENYRLLFDNFDFEKIAKYSQAYKEKLYTDTRIIRHRLKINAIINNAQRFSEVIAEFGSFYNYLVSFTKGEIFIRKDNQKVVENALSQKISDDLKRRGFQFVGGIIIYSYLQAIGIIIDHEQECDFYLKESNVYGNE